MEEIIVISSSDSDSSPAHKRLAGRRPSIKSERGTERQVPPGAEARRHLFGPKEDCCSLQLEMNGPEMNR